MKDNNLLTILITDCGS